MILDEIMEENYETFNHLEETLLQLYETNRKTLKACNDCLLDNIQDLNQYQKIEICNRTIEKLLEQIKDINIH